MVKEAVPVLSTHSCLKKLVGRLERMAAGSMRFTAWSTPQHRPAQLYTTFRAAVHTQWGGVGGRVGVGGGTEENKVCTSMSPMLTGLATLSNVLFTDAAPCLLEQSQYSSQHRNRKAGWTKA